MIDITGFDENGMQTYDTETTRAANILSVQVGALEYAPTLGVDLSYFLSNDLVFQNESFKAYLVQVLAIWGINVAGIAEALDGLSATYTINISPQDNSSGLVAR